MLHRIIQAGARLYSKTSGQLNTNSAPFMRAALSNTLTFSRHALLVLGAAALAAMTLMFVKPHFTEHLKAASPFTTEAQLMDTPSLAFADTAPSQPTAIKQPVKIALAVRKASLTDEQMVVSQWLSRRYRVAGDATHMLVSEAYKNAQQLDLDPLLILAVAAIESGFNPFAESAAGAQGLMQVMSKVHRDKFREHGGAHAALDPVANIKVGSAILKEYVRRGGSVEAGLKRYVGAAAFATDFGYGNRVLAEYRRLKEVAGRTTPEAATVASNTEQSAPVRPTTEVKKVVAEGKSAALAAPIDKSGTGAFSMSAI